MAQSLREAVDGGEWGARASPAPGFLALPQPRCWVLTWFLGLPENPRALVSWEWELGPLRPLTACTEVCCFSGAVLTKRQRQGPKQKFMSRGPEFRGPGWAGLVPSAAPLLGVDGRPHPASSHGCPSVGVS